MELIVISSSKLKIMLSADDMRRYDLGTDIDYANEQTRRAFRNILEEAKEKTGFDADNERLFIQLYPSKKGGCEVYITKIDDADEYDTKTDKDRDQRIPAQKKKSPKERKRIFSFSSTEPLIAVCKRLLSIKWRGESRAYRDENGIFYLTLKDKYSQDPRKADRTSFILEYGVSEPYELSLKYLGEHASCICQSMAVEKLGVL